MEQDVLTRAGDEAPGEGARLSPYLQGVLAAFHNSKNEYIRCAEERGQLRDCNSRLRQDAQETHELEKSHRNHLSTSREIIANLQESVSNLVPLKRDVKRMQAELEGKDRTIAVMHEELGKMASVHNEEMQTLRESLERQMEQISCDCEARIRNIEEEADTRVAQYTCVIAELNVKITELEIEHKEKMNMVVLEYEERLQRSASQMTQLRDQHAGLCARADSNIEVYRRRLEELEDKLKQSEFKNYVSSSARCQCNTQYDRPTNQTSSELADLVVEPEKAKPTPNCSQMRNASHPAPNPLQVVYFDSKPAHTSKPDKKTFNIVKKRKLYTDKDFH